MNNVNKQGRKPDNNLHQVTGNVSDSPLPLLVLAWLAGVVQPVFGGGSPDIFYAVGLFVWAEGY